MWGSFDPVALGRLIASRPGPEGAACQLQQVRVYTGRPEAGKDKKTYSAHMKQCHAWEIAGAQVFARTLRYPREWPDTSAQEKGVDVALAIDFVALALDQEYDVGVIFSTDTDLVPALEFVRTRFSSRCHIATAAWKGHRIRKPFVVQGRQVWCHYLDRQDYEAVADYSNYALKRPRPDPPPS